MKKIFFYIFILLFFFFWACTKEETENTEPVIPIVKMSFYPEDKSLDNSILTKPHVAFDHRIGNRMQDSSGGYYIIKIERATIIDSDNKIISASFSYSLLRDTIFFIMDQNFVSGKNYSISVTYSTTYSENGNEWKILSLDGGPLSKTVSSSFNLKSYSFPEGLENNDIEYSYPMPFQYHFHPNETDRGIIKIKDAELFAAFKDEKYKVRLSSHDGNNWESDAIYDASKQAFLFKIPTDKLENEKIYKFELSRVLEGGNPLVLVSWHFRTSKFDKFEEKLKSITNIEYLSSIDDRATYTSILWYSCYFSESFDQAEGRPFSGLIRFEAKPDLTNPFFVRFDDFYKRYNSYINISKRELALKIPPLNAIKLYEKNLSPLLTSNQINQNSAPASALTRQYIVYKLAAAYHIDYYIVRDHLVNLHMVPPPECRDLNHGNYIFRVYYYAGDLMTYESNDITYKF